MTLEEEMERTEAYTREEAALLLTRILKKLESRLSTARFRAREGDQVYLSFVRAAVQAVTALNQLIRDDEMQEISKRLDALEKMLDDDRRY
jgi:uncharacterized membrane-anchored protein